MKLQTTLLLGALAVAAGVPARAFDVVKYRLVDLTHAYDSQIVAEKKDFPFNVVSPQAEAGRHFDADALVALLDQVVRQLPVDEDRIYLTGLSMGGFATWAWAAQEPWRFAAIAPIAAGWTPEEACKLKDVPIWAFHGARDGVVPVGPHQQMVDAVIACGGDAKMTVYPELTTIPGRRPMRIPGCTSGSSSIVADVGIEFAAS